MYIALQNLDCGIQIGSKRTKIPSDKLYPCCFRPPPVLPVAASHPQLRSLYRSSIYLWSLQQRFVRKLINLQCSTSEDLPWSVAVEGLWPSSSSQTQGITCKSERQILLETISFIQSGATPSNSGVRVQSLLGISCMRRFVYGIQLNQHLLKGLI